MRLKSIWSNSELVFLNLSAIHHCRRVPVEAQLYFILTSNESVRIHCQIPDYARARCCGIYVTLIVATSRDVDEVFIPGDVHLWVSGGKIGCFFFHTTMLSSRDQTLDGAIGRANSCFRMIPGVLLSPHGYFSRLTHDCIHHSTITSSLAPRLLVGG